MLEGDIVALFYPSLPFLLTGNKLTMPQASSLLTKESLGDLGYNLRVFNTFLPF